MDRAAILAAWAEADRAHAVLPADREMADPAVALRALVVDRLTAHGADDELYDACAMLGRMIASRGGSPTFASATIDGVRDALAVTSAPWVASARAAVIEGFAAALAEQAARDASQAWEFPTCAVALGEAGVAVAAGLPSDDDEVIAAWAARVAKAAALAGVRRAVVSGGQSACAALVDAFGVVGIEANVAPVMRRR